MVDDDELVQHVAARAAPDALVLLDVPLDGCAELSRARPRRRVDHVLSRCSISILPSVKSGDRGPQLRGRLQDTRRDLRIAEIYPYAVLRTLHALAVAGRAFSFNADAHAIDLSPIWWTWPPKYKRESTVDTRRAAMTRVGVLLASVPGFASAVRSADGLSTAQLAALSDEYDALLGLVAGIAAVDGSSWAWTANVAEHGGATVSIADGWLRRRFEQRLDR